MRRKFLLFSVVLALALSVLPGCRSEEALFRFSERDVTRVRLQDGTTGECADFEGEELREILEFLNAVTYENVTPVETPEAGGWSWRLVVYGANGTASYRFEEDWIEVEGARYQVGRETVNALIEMLETKLK